MSMQTHIISCLLLMIDINQIAECHHATIYTGEHFVDVMAAPENPQIADKSGVLVLYQPECVSMLTLKEMDYAHHLVYLVHDPVTYPKHVWYKYREQDDLQKKYAGPDNPCFSAHYFEKGKSLDKAADVWSPEKGSLHTWVWNHVQKTVTIINDMVNEGIVVTQEPVAGGPVVETIQIGPNRKFDVLTYLSYTLRVTKTDHVTPVFAAVITDESEQIIIRKPRHVNIESYREEENDNLRFTSRWIYSHTSRLMKTFKQPLLVHNYTTIGYRKLQMPEEALKPLQEFYREKRAARLAEDFYKADAVIDISNYQAKTTMVQLTEELMDVLERYILPILEEFCNCKLKRSVIYGIREYYKGHLLRNHVDRAATHVIGAILQVDQDLDGGDDWLLEVINYDGERKHIKLLPGEMLIYEPCKLIHGRPQALQGKWYANAFMHYAPTSGWDYTDNGVVLKSPMHNIEERLTDFMTEVTRKQEFYKYQIHDEL